MFGLVWALGFAVCVVGLGSLSGCSAGFNQKISIFFWVGVISKIFSIKKYVLPFFNWINFEKTTRRGVSRSVFAVFIICAVLFFQSSVFCISYTSGPPVPAPVSQITLGDRFNAICQAGALCFGLATGGTGPSPVSNPYVNTPVISTPAAVTTLPAPPVAGGGTGSGGQNVTINTPISVSPPSVGVSAAPADSTAANSKAGALPSSATATTTGNIPAATISAAGKAALIGNAAAAAAVAAATTAGAVATGGASTAVAIAAYINLGLAAKALWDAFAPAANLTANAAGQLFGSLQSGSCITKLGAGFCTMPNKGVDGLITNAASPPAGSVYASWISGAGV